MSEGGRNVFLKRLDIVGFKSFAERISVEFVPGVTAVVGPNGSGKSNITDAIRWVLGEQSARSLRGVKMEDIIFGGSDTRKSLNVAEVTLTLDNEDQFIPIDYQELSVTRRVFRSGESEFLINKQSCRLKDIVDLFMDSGLGKEAFSIISQGKVEEILSSKSEERRSIFEEAAGVLKYKTRKKKAEVKLFETQDNLHRVEDILHELETQVEPLEIQASIAKDYLEKKEELEKNEVALTVYEIEKLHENWTNLKQSFSDHKDREVKLSTKIQGEEADIAQMREKAHILDDSIDDLQEVLLSVSKELEKLEGRKEVLKERKKNYHQNRAKLAEQIDEYARLIEKLEIYTTKEQEVLVSSSQVLKELEKNLKQKNIELSAADENIEETIEQLKSDYIELLNRQASLNNEQSNIEQQLKASELRNQRLDNENHKYLASRESIEGEKKKSHDSLLNKQSDMDKHVSIYEKLKFELDKQKQEYEKKESQLYQAYQFVQQARSRKEVLEEMQEDYSGFFHGVKEVLKERAKLTGIEGAVAELVQVDKLYETAIETALGSGAQSIVVQTEANARDAINLLKKNRSGRATFLPLSVMKPRYVDQGQLSMMQSHPSFVGVASDVINYDHKYKDVISNLLGSVIITKDLKGANELAKLINYRYRFVTVEGDVVNPGGSMTGGGNKQTTTSLFSRQRELETISSKVIDMETKTAKLEKSVKDLKRWILDNEKNLGDLREETESYRLGIQTIKSSLREVEVEEKNLNDRLRLYDQEKRQIVEEKQELLKKQERNDQTLISLAIKIDQLDSEIKNLSEQKKTQQTSKDSLVTEVTNLKVEMAEKKEQVRAQQEKVSRLNKEFEETKEKLDIAKRDVEFLDDEMSTDSSGEHKLDGLVREKEIENERTIKLIQERRQERLSVNTKLEDRERELKEWKRQLKQKTELLKDEEVRITRLDVELETRLNHLSEDYSLTFEAAKDRYLLPASPEETKKQVKLTKMAIEELGTVNLGAIDEYDRVSQRYSFLTEQRDDLIKAKETLHQVINEMDEEMIKRFETTFLNIQSHFGGVFRELFGGGRADLVLTEPGDMLNTGIDIVAQPPGKKLQNLGLLSGGERALTAIALLFAILKVRPVPFCVLDEVEAALDEANVHRFASYLNQFSKETQFIVITHRKGTMEEADVLYGVTMQESGVSKLVSVRLEDSKEVDTVTL